MTVLAFSLARFTPADVIAFRHLAGAKQRNGAWRAVERQTGQRFDRFVIFSAGGERALFSLERDASGRYRILFHHRGALHCISEGSTAAECLSLWRPRAARRRRPRPAAATE